MNKTWRPKGWHNNDTQNMIKDAMKNGHIAGIQGNTLFDIYEAGADAMLEALKEQGEHIDANAAPLGYVMQQIGTVPRSFKGWFIIIPDEVE